MFVNSSSRHYWQSGRHSGHTKTDHHLCTESGLHATPSSTEATCSSLCLGSSSVLYSRVMQADKSPWNRQEGATQGVYGGKLPKREPSQPARVLNWNWDRNHSMNIRKNHSYRMIQPHGTPLTFVLAHCAVSSHILRIVMDAALQYTVLTLTDRCRRKSKQHEKKTKRKTENV